MVTVNKSVSILPSVLELGVELSKKLKMSFSGMVSAFIVRFGLEAEDRIMMSGDSESVIFSDLARKLQATLSRLKVEA